MTHFLMNHWLLSVMLYASVSVIGIPLCFFIGWAIAGLRHWRDERKYR